MMRAATLCHSASPHSRTHALTHSRTLLVRSFRGRPGTRPAVLRATALVAAAGVLFDLGQFNVECSFEQRTQPRVRVPVHDPREPVAQEALKNPSHF